MGTFKVKVEEILDDIWPWAGFALDRARGAWRRKRDDARVNLGYGISAGKQSSTSPHLYLRGKMTALDLLTKLSRGWVGYGGDN
jgi:hypothetical protein